jgi:TolB-like protein
MSNHSLLHFAHFEVRRQEDGAPWELGRGAMGVTYKAYDPQLRVYVALKVINPAQVGDAKARALFLREARAAARVRHANVGSVVYLNQDPENMFYAMEFIAGESLRDWLHSRVPLSPLMAIGLSLQIARGLEAIHREEVIHRDLKPTNLMIVRADKQRPESDPEAWLIKIIDFGLARNVAGDVSETSAVAGTTGFRGTALYASPEQCEERRDLDGRADLYSLGCVMWEMLVGTPPFRANVHRELLNAHVAKPPPLQQLSHLPLGLQAVVARLLLKDREARFADAGAVIRALEKSRGQIERGEDAVQVAAQTDTSLSATTVLPEPKAKVSAEVKPRSNRSRMIRVAVACAALLALGAVVGWKAGWIGRMSPTNGERAKWDAPVVAILPFDATDGSKEETKLADSMTSELINRVSQLPGTRVISRGAVMAYKISPGGAARKRVRTIDAELGGVTGVLEGSVDRVGDELKINTVLYDAKTERRLWGYTYRRDWNDATAAEKEVPDQIARALHTRFEAAKRETPGQRLGPGPTAADLYFQALPMDPHDPNRKALLEQAIVKDPKFAEAYAESSLYELTADFPEEETAKTQETGEELNRKALALDPNCVPALVHLSGFRRGAGADQEADALLARGLKLGPNFMRANLFTGFHTKSPDEAYAHVRRAHAMDPDVRRVMFFLERMAREYHLPELAEHWLKKINAITNDLQMRNLAECEALILRGDYAKALDRLRLFPPDLVKDHWSVRELMYQALLGAGKYEAALALLERIKPNEEPHYPEIDRAELLLRLGRVDEARQTAERFAKFQTRIIEESKAKNEPIRIGYFRLAKALEILGRQAEAVEQLDKFAQLETIPIPYPDPWIFRDSPAALDRLAKIKEKSDLIAKRILDIEKSYSSPEAQPVLR